MRESNIELLRIVSMVLIIMHHFTVHGTFPFTQELTFNKVFLQVFGLGGKAGVVAFIEKPIMKAFTPIFDCIQSRVKPL